MTFVSSSIIRDDWQGTRTFGETVPEFQVQWLVEVSSKTDGAEYVLNFCGLPLPGQPYLAGSDVNVEAICKSVTVSPIAEKYWRATVSYGPPDEDENDKLDEENKPTEDVGLEGVEVQMGLVRMTKPAVRGMYLGQHQGIGFIPRSWRGGPQVKPNAADLGVGNGDAITNSAGAAFDPPVEIDYSRIVVNISKNEKNFNANKVLAYNDTVNLDAINLRFRGFKLDIKPLTAKMQSISAARRIKNGKVYWRVSYEFHVDDHFGWRVELLDRGYSRSGLWDADNEAWLKISLDPSKNRHLPANKPITDDNGFSANEPVLLDGEGMPLKAGQDPFFLHYGVYKEINWAPLKLNDIGWMF